MFRSDDVFFYHDVSCYRTRHTLSTPQISQDSEIRIRRHAALFNKAEHPTPRKPSVQIPGIVQPLPAIRLALSLGAHVL